MDVESGAEGPSVEEVPPPPLPPAGPSARRTRVQLPDHDHDDGPTYYRLGIDYPIDADDDEVMHQCARIKLLGFLLVAVSRRPAGKRGTLSSITSPTKFYQNHESLAGPD